ncbi:hypothetical protein BTN50_1895 [Candidatus Enterovibrio altilux]|uniref:Uncharacterized protein n=1 Tax=Candidatus Enterovibrio altilux TaxID=1927128 RepID=A0A291BBI8_9GAMM|nr:hypothetical protein BTN50_1895 [Candidatus Enterovibrio luxaltus]
MKKNMMNFETAVQFTSTYYHVLIRFTHYFQEVGECDGAE